MIRAAGPATEAEVRRRSSRGAGGPARIADEGFATVLVLALSLVLALLGATAASVGGIAVARARAASAADLSALAAAGAALDGQGPACGRASRVAQRVGARLAQCRVVGDVAEVVAEVRPPGPLGRLGSAAARARAGPAQEPEGPDRP